MDAVASKPRLEFLIRGETAQVHRRVRVRSKGNGACDESTVIPPVEPNPRPSFPWLILHVRGLIEFFVVVNSEYSGRREWRRSRTAQLRREKPCRYAREHHQSREPVKVRNTHPASKSRNLRSIPRDGEENGRISENAKVIRVMGIFPDVLARENQVLPKSLLQACMEFIAPARSERSRIGGRATQKRVKHSIVAADA